MRVAFPGELNRTSALEDAEDDEQCHGGKQDRDDAPLPSPVRTSPKKRGAFLG